MDVDVTAVTEGVSGFVEEFYEKAVGVVLSETRRLNATMLNIGALENIKATEAIWWCLGSGGNLKAA